MADKFDGPRGAQQARRAGMFVVAVYAAALLAVAATVAVMSDVALDSLELMRPPLAYLILVVFGVALVYGVAVAALPRLTFYAFFVAYVVTAAVLLFFGLRGYTTLPVLAVPAAVLVVWFLVDRQFIQVTPLLLGRGARTLLLAAPGRLALLCIALCIGTTAATFFALAVAGSVVSPMAAIMAVVVSLAVTEAVAARAVGSAFGQVPSGGFFELCCAAGFGAVIGPVASSLGARLVCPDWGSPLALAVAAVRGIDYFNGAIEARRAGRAAGVPDAARSGLVGVVATNHYFCYGVALPIAVLLALISSIQWPKKDPHDDSANLVGVVVWLWLSVVAAVALAHVRAAMKGAAEAVSYLELLAMADDATPSPSGGAIVLEFQRAAAAAGGGLGVATVAAGGAGTQAPGNGFNAGYGAVAAYTAIPTEPSVYPLPNGAATATAKKWDSPA